MLTDALLGVSLAFLKRRRFREDGENKFMINLAKNLNAFNPEEELSDAQIEWIFKLHKKYCK